MARKQHWDDVVHKNEEDRELFGCESGRLADNREPEPRTNNACFERARWKAIYLRHHRIRQNWLTNQVFVLDTEKQSSFSRQRNVICPVMMNT